MLFVILPCVWIDHIWPRLAGEDQDVGVPNIPIHSMIVPVMHEVGLSPNHRGTQPLMVFPEPDKVNMLFQCSPLNWLSGGGGVKSVLTPTE